MGVGFDLSRLVSRFLNDYGESFGSCEESLSVFRGSRFLAGSRVQRDTLVESAADKGNSSTRSNDIYHHIKNNYRPFPS